jgi:predicted regulator of Ras-like GTPase activity (Roadblock/LC7/MglB family)
VPAAAKDELATPVAVAESVQPPLLPLQPASQAAPSSALPNLFATAPGSAFGALGTFELPLPDFDDDPMPLESLQPPPSPAPSEPENREPSGRLAEPTPEQVREQPQVVKTPEPAAEEPAPAPAARASSFELPPVVKPAQAPPVSPPPVVTPSSPPPPLAAESPKPSPSSAGAETTSAFEPGETEKASAPLIPPPAFVAPASSPVAAPRVIAPLEDLTFGYVDDPTQLALRAIFSTEKTMRPQDIVDFSSQFPGIRGCLIITAEGVTRSGRLDDSEEVRQFSEKAGALFEKTSSLIAELGLGTEQTFTLRTGQSIMSFFTQGDICLAVLHGQANFLPGVREKLILVTRELAKMLAA